MNIFDPDSKLMQALHDVGELIILNLCFVICCVPIVSIGASYTAMYTVSLHEAEGYSGSTLGRFFRTFIFNLKKGTILWVVLLAMGGALLYCHLFLSMNPQFSTVIYRGALLLVNILFILIATISFPIQARYDNSVFRTLRNGLIISVAFLPQVALMAVFNYLPVFLLYFNQELFLRLLIIWAFLGFSVTARVNSFFAVRVFRKLELENS